MNGCGVLARITFKTGDEYALKLSRLGDASEKVAKKAIYEGVNIVAGEMRKNLEGVPNIHHDQKEDLQESFGVTPIQKDDKGFWNAKIGFDGYGSHPTKAYPKGIPNQLLARAVESGTSFRSATPFVRRAVNATKKKSLEKMKQVVDEEVQNIMKE